MIFIQLTAHFIQFEISSDGTIPSLSYFCRIIKMPIVKKTDTRFMKIYIDYSKADICKIDYSAKEIVPEIIDFPRLSPQQEKELTARVRRNVDRVFRKILKRKKPDIIRIYVGEKDFSWAGQFFSAPSNASRRPALRRSSSSSASRTSPRRRRSSTYMLSTG